MFGSGMNLVMAVIGFGISTVFIFSVCTRMACDRFASRREQLEDLQHPHAELREQTIHGLEQFVVAKFPTTKFNSDDFSSEEDAQCSICLGEYQERDVLRIMPKCCHAFHVTCIIDTWLLKQSTCTLCRLSPRDLYDVASPTFLMATQTEDSPHTTTLARSLEQGG